MVRTKESASPSLTTLGAFPDSELKLLWELVRKYQIGDVVAELIEARDPFHREQAFGWATWNPARIRIYAGPDVALISLRKLLLHEFAHLVTFHAKHDAARLKGKHRGSLRPECPGDRDERFRGHGTFFYEVAFDLYETYLITEFPYSGPAIVANEMMYRPRGARRAAFNFAERHGLAAADIARCMDTIAEMWTHSRRPQKRITPTGRRFLADLAFTESRRERAACEASQ